MLLLQLRTIRVAFFPRFVAPPRFGSFKKTQTPEKVTEYRIPEPKPDSNPVTRSVLILTNHFADQDRMTPNDLVFHGKKRLKNSSKAIKAHDVTCELLRRR